LRTLSVTQQAKVLEDGKGITRGGTERLCRSVWKSYRFELVGEKHAAVFLYDLVDNEHNQLAQCRGCCGRHHGRSRFVQLEAQEQGVCEQPAVNGREIGDEREEGLEYLELYVDALRHAVVHCLDDGRDRREGDGAQGDEALEGTEGNRDYFGILRCAAHEDGAKKVFCMPAIYRNEVRSRKKRQTRNCSWAYQREIALHRNRRTTGATTMFIIEMQCACTPASLQRIFRISAKDENVPEAKLAVT